MYNGDPRLRNETEVIEYTPELIQEYIKCKEDIIYFAEKYFKIVTIDKGEILIPLWDFQKKMIKSFVDPGPDKRHVCVLSSRQIGKSTIATIYIVWYALFHMSKTIAILANKEKTAMEILRRIKFAYQCLPLWLQQGVTDGGWNKGSIALENGTRMIAVSTGNAAIRGQTINLLYLDEFAFVPSHIADDFMSSVYPTISSGETSKIIIVSTPNGLNHYYHIYRNAVLGDNNFKPIKIRWDEVPGKTSEWKESVIKDIGIVRWNQEYGCFWKSNNINTYIRNKLSGKIIKVSIGDLYEKENIL